MKLKLKNIGMFKQAEVLLDGITVIAGSNDSGKSTIGKVLFSIIKADNIARFSFKNYRITKFLSLINEIIAFLSIKGKLSSADKEQIDKLSKEILGFFQSSLPKKERVKKKESIINELNQIFLNQKFKEKPVGDTLSQILDILDDNKAFLLSRKKTLQNQIAYNFDEDIVHRQSESGKIVLENLYEVTIRNRKVIEFRDFLPKDLSGRRIRPIRDVTLIESPLVMTLTSFFNSLNYIPDEYKKDIKYPNMMRDVIRKLINPKINSSDSDDVKDIINFIKDTISGEFRVSKDNKILFYKGKYEFNTLNVAMGIKSFGVILLLLKNGYIKDFSTLLIVDEPEVHLHPEWHIKYAELLVKIHSSLNCNIIINTHSPYIVQAIRKYSYKYSCLEKTNFYFSKRLDPISATIELVNDNLSLIFDSLTSPIEEVIT